MDSTIGRRGAAHTVFVGRTPELAVLQDGLAHTGAGRGGLWLLVGDAGIGKTRTAAELAERATDFDIHWGRCREAEGAPAFWPWIEVVRSLLRRHGSRRMHDWLGAGLSDVARVVPEVAEDEEAQAPSTDEPQALFRLCDHFATMAVKAAAEQPILIVLDDLHWADHASLTLLQHMLPALPEAPIMVVGTYRPLEARADETLAAALSQLARRGTTLRLDGLKREETDSFLRLALGRPISAEMADLVHHQTAGNALFLSEIARELARRPGETVLQPRRLQPTEGIRQALRHRFARVSDRCTWMLRVAAIIGREVDLGRLRSTCRILEDEIPGLHTDSTLDSIDEARRAEILEATGEPERYQFSHPLIRDVSETDLSATHRAIIHRAVASVLERIGAANGSLIGELAHHLVAAASLGEIDKAVEYSRLAGDRFRRQYAFEEAAGRYATALRTLDLDSGERTAAPERQRLRAELLIELGRARALAPTGGDAAAAFAAAAEIGRAIGDGELIGQAALGLVGPDKLGLGGDFADARIVEEALAALPEIDHPLRPVLLIRSLLPLYYTQERQLALQRSAEAVAIAERVCDDATLGQVLGERLTVLYGPDHLDERMSLVRRILAIAARSNRPNLSFLGHMWSALHLLQRGEMELACAEFDRCSVFATQTRRPFERWQLEVSRAMLALLGGDLAEAEDIANRAAATGAAAGVPNAAVMLSIQTFRIRLEQGRLDEMEPIIVEFARSMAHIPAARGPLPLAYAHMGRLDDARRTFDALANADFEDYPRDSNFLTGLTDAAHVCWFLDDQPRARRLYELLQPLEPLTVIGSWFAACSGTVGHYLGLLATVLGRWDAAARHFDGAERAYAKMGARPLLGRLLLDYAEMLSRSGTSPPHAVATARRAAEALDDLDMPAWQVRCRALLDRLATAGPGSAQGGARPNPCIFRCDGDFWTIAYSTSPLRIKDLKGLQLLRTLLREPGREFHVADLVGAPVAAGGAADDTLPDVRARSEYRNRIASLRDVLNEAEENNDLGAATRAREELDRLREEIAAAYLPTGHARSRDRLQENMRKAVAKNIRAAVARIGAKDEALARHLTNSIHTGVFCSYRPERPLHWLLD